LIGLQTKVGDGVEAFVEAADRVGEAAAAPLVDVLDLAAAVLDELAHTLDGAREAFIAHIGADDHNKLVVSQNTSLGLKLNARAQAVNGSASRAERIIAHGNEDTSCEVRGGRCEGSIKRFGVVNQCSFRVWGMIGFWVSCVVCD